jgi:hypothetical protein
MATCLDLSYSRDVSTALAVEAKYAGPGKSKGFGGDRSNQGPEKRQRLVIRPFNTPSNNLYSSALPLPPLQQLSRVPLVLVFPHSRVHQLAASIVGSLDISSKTAHIRSGTTPIISRTLGVQAKARETRQIMQRAGI